MQVSDTPPISKLSLPPSFFLPSPLSSLSTFFPFFFSVHFLISLSIISYFTETTQSRLFSADGVNTFHLASPALGCWQSPSARSWRPGWVAQGEDLG